jgi:hypothetical protein
MALLAANLKRRATRAAMKMNVGITATAVAAVAAVVVPKRNGMSHSIGTWDHGENRVDTTSRVVNQLVKPLQVIDITSDEEKREAKATSRYLQIY